MQSRGLHGLTATCKRCRSERANAYHKVNPQSRIAAALKLKYGITLEQWNEMFAAQAGCCKICNAHQSTLRKRLAVDHCHTTGEIRGLLCQHCNQMLGHARDNTATLAAAIRYLTER